MLEDEQVTKAQTELRPMNWAVDQPTSNELRLLCGGQEMARTSGHAVLVIAAKFYAALKEHGQSGADLYAEGVYNGLHQGVGSKPPSPTEQPPPTA